MNIKEEDKDLNYWKKNCEDDYLHTPISVLRYITKLEKIVNDGVLDKTIKSVCTACSGSGRYCEHNCSSCNGTGEETE